MTGNTCPPGFATYVRRAGLPQIGGPHGLRHSLTPTLDASGNGLATISALLGHASAAVTSKVYTHMLKGADRAAIDSHAASLQGTWLGGDRPKPLAHPVRRGCAADKRQEWRTLGWLTTRG